MNNPTLPQASRPNTSTEQEARDRAALQGALSALSDLAVTWLRRNGAPPSQSQWEAVERAILDDGEVLRGS